MRRLFVLASVVGVFALASLYLLLRAGPSPVAAKDVAAAGEAVQPSAALPVSRVVLYSSGVGYFQRAGKVKGSCRVDLAFPAADINDLLKSLVLRDLGGGQVTAVACDSHDPIDKTLQSFAINLNNSPSLAAILSQARGEKVEAVLQQGAAGQPGTLTGSIVGVETQKQQLGKDTTVDAAFLNLWCAEGLRSVKLADVQRLRFLNPALDTEVRQALEVLALGHDSQKKAVSIAFSGEGEREVRVGYVTEAPMWKTSYRLVLGKDGKPQLQGWAIVENPSDEDWSGVGMALVSGRPISFRMDLYQPLYVPRPLVEPELFASLRPPTYEGDMAGKDKAAKVMNGAAPAPPEDSAASAFGARAGAEKRAYRRQLLRSESIAGDQLGLQKELADTMDLGKGVRSAATGQQLGESFQYVIDQPVTVARQKSAMLPVVTQPVEGERLSIYNEATHAKFPLLGLRLKNTTGLHLMQGPVTVFDGSAYAGDARFLDIPPGDERLISYAVDLNTEVQPVVENPRQHLTKVKLLKGILYSTSRLVEGKTYKLKSRSGGDRTVLVEHPYRPDFRLTSQEKPAETARDVYRFAVRLPAGKEASLTVTEERDLGSQMALTNLDDNSIRVFLQDAATSPAAKEALRKAVELKGKADRSRQELAHAEQLLADIERDQARLRANLKETPPTAAAYKKYLAKLDQQENEVDDLREQIKKLRDQELRQRQQYEAFLAALDVD
jgi:hypothetical protein